LKLSGAEHNRVGRGRYCHTSVLLPQLSGAVSGTTRYPMLSMTSLGDSALGVVCTTDHSRTRPCSSQRKAALGAELAAACGPLKTLTRTCRSPAYGGSRR